MNVNGVVVRERWLPSGCLVFIRISNNTPGRVNGSLAGRRNHRRLFCRWKNPHGASTHTEHDSSKSIFPFSVLHLIIYLLCSTFCIFSIHTPVAPEPSVNFHAQTLSRSSTASFATLRQVTFSTLHLHLHPTMRLSDPPYYRRRRPRRRRPRSQPHSCPC